MMSKNVGVSVKCAVFKRCAHGERETEREDGLHIWGSGTLYHIYTAGLSTYLQKFNKVKIYKTTYW